MKFSIPEEQLRKVVVRKAYDHVVFLAYMLDSKDENSGSGGRSGLQPKRYVAGDT